MPALSLFLVAVEDLVSIANNCADSPAMDAKQLKDNFDLLDSWEERYQFIIELGKNLPPMAAADKTEANRILGCQSQVWMIATAEGEGDLLKVHFVADSDAHIVRGLIGIVRILFDGRSPQEIVDYDVEAFFDSIDLRANLSSGRGNGLKEMIKRVKLLATSYMA